MRCIRFSSWLRLILNSGPGPLELASHTGRGDAAPRLVLGADRLHAGFAPPWTKALVAAVSWRPRTHPACRARYLEPSEQGVGAVRARLCLTT
jgi:hypothetical protein